MPVASTPLIFKKNGEVVRRNSQEAEDAFIEGAGDISDDVEEMPPMWSISMFLKLMRPLQHNH